MEVGIILGQDAYEPQRPLDYKIGTQSEPFSRSNRARMGSQWTHDGQKKTNFFSFRLRRGFKVAENRFQYQRRQSIKEGTAST